jgi:hypothetical protein
MKRILTIPLMVLVSLFALGCEDDSTGLDRFGLEDFEGTSEATRIQFINNADPSQRVDLISEGGNLSLRIDREGRFVETSFNPRTGVTETRTGTAEVQGGNLVLNDDAGGEPRVFSLTRSRDNLFTLSRTNDRFDFDNDGELEPATFEVDLLRTTT